AGGPSLHERQGPADEVKRCDPKWQLMGGTVPLHAGQRLAVLRAPFPANDIRDAGPRHQIAFITRIDEYRGGELVAFLRREAADVRIFFMNLVEALPNTHRDLGLGEHLLEDRLGDVRLEVEAIRTVLHLRRSGPVLFDVVVVNPREELTRI